MFCGRPGANCAEDYPLHQTHKILENLLVGIHTMLPYFCFNHSQYFGYFMLYLDLQILIPVISGFVVFISLGLFAKNGVLLLYE